ncbi:MAG: nicotinate-nucleotide--dimethylbenzimidazole phosphoribosyltransferase [Candidatus Omnitrophota bacterium]
MGKLQETIQQIERIDFSLAEKTQNQLDSLTKPQGSLGRLEELAKQVVEITRKEKPSLKNKVIFTMAGDHGVTEEGVSAFPQEVTAQMVDNFLQGGAGINVLSRHVGARVVVCDMGTAKEIQNPKSLPEAGPPQADKTKNFKEKKIAFGTKNMVKGPAMTFQEAMRAIENGICVFEEEFEKGIDVVGTGDMGIGNTTPSSAITAVITGRPVKEVTGKGTGIDDQALFAKIKTIEKAIAMNKPNAENAIDVLAKVGGFEIGGIAGVILAAAAHRVPVVIDGFISGAGALIAYKLEPKVKDYMIAGHCSVEKGHKILLEHLSLRPLLDLNLRLGEGTGAALGIGLVEAAVKILTEMATFRDAEVSEKINSY